MNKLIAIAASIAAAASFTAPVHASQPDSVKVDFADLNLRTEQGVAHFDRRIERAIEKVCDYNGNLSDRLNQSAARQCVRETMADATTARNTIIDAHQRGEVEVFASLVIERPLRR